MKKSIALTPLYPGAVSDQKVFAEALNLFQQYGISVVEHVSAPELLAEKGRFLRDRGLESVYLGAVVQKREKSSLCNPDERQRCLAVDLAKQLADHAAQAQACKLLLTSGWRPENPDHEQNAYDALTRSFAELLDYVGNELALVLEPGDRDVDYFQLIGPTRYAVTFISQFGGKVGLVLDTSHVAQLGEELRTATMQAKPYCSHIHLANCVLKKESPLFGDKHPCFDVVDGVYRHEDMLAYFAWLQTLYQADDVTIGVEFINREGDAFAKNIVDGTPWFFMRC